MRAVIQRVFKARLTVDGEEQASIERGIAVYLGIGPNDDEKVMDYMLDKFLHLRIFEDEQGKMNRSVDEIGGQILIVSNFTLYGDCRRGRRPSYSNGAEVEKARVLYERFTQKAAAASSKITFGVFQADMRIEQVNDGPVTLLLDSDKVF